MGSDATISPETAEGAAQGAAIGGDGVVQVSTQVETFQLGEGESLTLTNERGQPIARIQVSDDI